VARAADIDKVPAQSKPKLSPMRTPTKLRPSAIVVGASAILSIAACKGSTGSGGGGGGGASCDGASFCAVAIDDGSVPCPGMGAEQLSTLETCSAASCPTECMGRFGRSDGLGNTCLDCLTMQCTTALQACDDH